jgi:hypothetical protein
LTGAPFACGLAWAAGLDWDCGLAGLLVVIA